MSEYLPVREKYKWPCFATCAQCSCHGVIVFADGSQTDQILSIEGGKTLLKTLVGSGKISTEDADRIEDHLNCSEILPTEGCVNELTKHAQSVVGTSKTPHFDRGNEESGDDSKSFAE